MLRTMGPEVTEALLAIACSRHQSRRLPQITDWSALLDAIDRHGLLPLASTLIRASDAPESIKQATALQTAALAMRSAQQEQLSAGVLAALRAAGVDTMVLKGPALGRTVYPHPSLRASRDLDVLVRQEHWTEAHKALLELGYQSLQPHDAPPPKVSEHKAYYHTQYYHEQYVHLVEVHYDLWYYGLRPALGELFWERAVPLTLGGASTRAPSPEDMLLHLCVHLDHHGYERLIWFTDLALLAKATPNLDWEYLVRAARTEGLAITVYYSLWYLERLLGVAAPKWVLEQLRPGFVQAWVHDRVCPPARVLSLEMADRAECDFHEVPLASELALNFVLTGRRREKLSYLAHLLHPSTEWLAYYYGTSDPALLRRLRLVHAPKMLGRAFAELFLTVTHRTPPAARISLAATLAEPSW